jgi:hypothetical protein
MQNPARVRSWRVLFVWAVWLVSPREAFQANPRRVRSSCRPPIYPPGLAARATGLTKEMEKYSDTAAKATAPVPCDINIPAVTRKRRRSISREAWASIRGAVLHERDGLPENSPRRTPTLPRLRWMEVGR